MNLCNFVSNQLAPLNIAVSKKEIVVMLLKNYDLSEAQKVLNSCITKETSEQNTTLMILITEIEQHISMFNDDLESDEILYND